MRMIRLFGTAVAAAGIVLSGVAVASADVPTAAPVLEPYTGSASGSSNFGTGLSNLLSTGSGDVKPLPTRSEIATGYDNPWLDGWGNGSGNLAIGLYRLFGSGSSTPA
ncbi:hypothetical protein [Nocardia sp. NPDC005366]|uniref:hypothetical protein n=1 Tax=Nocardia sp. NPDC005366 TaxID=3156878 RepID=UPI0033B30A0B